MSNMVSVGLFRKDMKARASEVAMQLIEEGYTDVHVEIEWASEFNRALGPYIGFWANGRMDHCHCKSVDDCCGFCSSKIED
jgi:hypothetical protein